MLVVGLTGGIGSGKTAVSDRFAEHGIDIIDADLASRVVVEPGRPALDEIRKHFGDEMILEDGNMNRALMRERVFADPAERKFLEGLLHPLINREIERGIAAARSAYAILVSPLLFETGQDRYAQRILVIDVPLELQIRRTMARDNNTEAQVRNIINAQTDRETRLSRADDIIVNDADLDTLTARVDALHARYLEIAGRAAE